MRINFVFECKLFVYSLKFPAAGRTHGGGGVSAEGFGRRALMEVRWEGGHEGAWQLVKVVGEIWLRRWRWGEKIKKNVDGGGQRKITEIKRVNLCCRVQLNIRTGQRFNEQSWTVIGRRLVS